MSNCCFFRYNEFVMEKKKEKLHIRKLGINGEGIGYLDKLPVFVPGALVHEDVQVQIEKEYPTYARAKLEKIEKKAFERVKPVCEVADQCGGCAIMHLNSNFHAQYKRQMLCEAIYKYAKIPSSLVRETKSSGSDLHYRSACKMPVASIDNQLQTGLYAVNSNKFIPLDKCYVQSAQIEALRKAITEVCAKHRLQAFQAKTSHGLRYLVIRSIDNHAQCTLITGKDTIGKDLVNDLMKIEGLIGVFQSINDVKNSVDIFGSKPKKLAGADTIPYPLQNLTLQLSPASFAQLNIETAKLLYETAVSKIDPCDVLVEAYCGIGAMSLLASNKAKRIYGIESIQDAIDNAERNAAENNIDNVKFICDDSAKGLAKILETENVNTLLVDPPRSGLDDRMLRVIRTSNIDKIIYISCNPSTLAKNLANLSSTYHPVSIIPFDMFPQTPHVESITVLLRNGYQDGKIDKTKRKRQAKARAKRCITNSTKQKKI